MTDRQTPEQIAREIIDGIMSPKSTGSHPRTVYSTFVNRAETERIIASAIRSAVNERLEMAANQVFDWGDTDKNDALVNDDLMFLAGVEMATRAGANLVRSLKFDEPKP